MDLSEVESATEQAWCEYHARCGTYPDVATCKATTVTGMDPVVAAVRAGNVRYDGKAASQCVDMIRGWDCGIQDKNKPTPCSEVFKGTVETGGACALDEACVSGDCRFTKGCPGTCKAPEPEIPVGGDCSDSDCVWDAYCDGSFERPTCVALIPEGQACDPQDEGDYCLGSTFCKANSSGSGGTCAVGAAEGEACEYNYHCRSLLDYCDTKTRKCTHRLGVGEACSSDRECIDYALCDSGVCVSLKKQGETCYANPKDLCMGYLDCREGICTLPAVAECP